MSAIQITASSSTWTNPPIPLFLIIWTADSMSDAVEDRARVWGIFSDETESRRAFDEVLKLKTPLTERGSFSWHRVENVNHGPDDIDRDIEFETSGS